MNQKIKSIKGIHVNYSMEDPSKPTETEWIETNSYVSSLNEYDTEGNLIKSSSYNQGDVVHEYYEYVYDANHNMIEELCYFDENELAEHKFITWNEKNLPSSEKVIYQEDGGENTTYFTYDANNLILEKKILDQDGELEEMEIFTYSDNKLISEKKTDCDKKPVYTKSYKYDESGNVIEYEYSSPDPYEYSRHEYFYHENGERKKTLHYNHKNQLIAKEITEFDEQGNVIELVEENQKSKKITRLYYDENKNQIKQEEFNHQEILTTSIERTFNENNKLVESLIYSQDPEEGVQQMYAYKYEYKYWEE